MIRLTSILFLSVALRVAALDALQLSPLAQVGSAGVFLDDIATSTNFVVPHLRVAAAPRLGQSLTLSQKQLEAALSHLGGVAVTNWVGSPQVRINRRVRSLEEDELKLLLTRALQQENIKDRGELELRLARPWAPVNVPEESLSVKIVDLPGTGPAPLFMCRFELGTSNEVVGTWQASLHAKVWRDVWVSHTALRRGALLADADLVRERRDVLTVRDALAEFAVIDASIEAGEHIPPNVPLLARSLKVKPAVRRGQFSQATVVDGALAISLKVEVLEDGVPGQIIRIRNPQTRRELRGKVQNEQTILVSL